MEVRTDSGSQSIQDALARLDERVSGALKRIDESANRDGMLHEINRKLDVLQAEINGRMQRMEERLISLEGRVTEHGRQIDVVRQEPAIKWKNVTGQIIQIVIAAGVGFLVSQIIGG